MLGSSQRMPTTTSVNPQQLLTSWLLGLLSDSLTRDDLMSARSPSSSEWLSSAKICSFCGSPSSLNGIISSVAQSSGSPPPDNWGIFSQSVSLPRENRRQQRVPPLPRNYTEIERGKDEKGKIKKTPTETEWGPLPSPPSTSSPVSHRRVTRRGSGVRAHCRCVFTEATGGARLLPASFCCCFFTSFLFFFRRESLTKLETHTLKKSEMQSGRNEKSSARLNVMRKT